MVKAAVRARMKSGLKLADDLMLRETFAPLLSSEKGRYFSFVVLALAAALLVAGVINLFRTGYSDWEMTRMKKVETAHLSRGFEESGLIAGIPNQHLFGLTASADTNFLPVTSLQMRLTGVIKNARDNSSRAIVSSAGQVGKVFGVGDEVAPGIKINAINDDGIVLEHSGQFEKLPLARSQLTFNEKPKSLWQM